MNVRNANSHRNGVRNRSGTPKVAYEKPPVSETITIIWPTTKTGSSLMYKKMLDQRAIDPGRKNMIVAKTAINISPMSEK